MAAITIFSDLGAQEKKVVTVSIVSPSIFHKVMRQDVMILAFCHKGDVIGLSEVIDISPGKLDSGLCSIHPGILYDIF